MAERERLFLVYAKQWWREFLQIRASHSNRLVKIFAQDECGTNRPVCSFVCPLRAGRLLDSPRQAARFVSLLGYEHSPSVGGGKVEMWSSLHAFLCKGKGVSKILKMRIINQTDLLHQQKWTWGWCLRSWWSQELKMSALGNHDNPVSDIHPFFYQRESRVPVGSKST